LDFTVKEQLQQIPMDPVSTPVGITGVAVVALGLLVNKKLKGWLQNLSGEWEE
jgi:hypothetical protein